mmetsp:Transcript_2833/g.8315  ORF Transcript_2833/g.8315 Transcript_2833/m.8315 type:complete len:215 (+) Transcript_2833:79-723(+)|eukprot:CAMPEP_0181042542 /NCGR_PEP_ID=MMETSP1070-20121207/12208_1 /TAXON_ID=265543 /ORGANISM="Minutocellus polymorphus, Strain NH13" /LENGTH=214 /DNA_ID=CAMNT_0023120767 /DNA_START=22 /DNA_END=666 /DNA_ORIENTATION=-
MASLPSMSPDFSIIATGLDTPISLHRTFGNGATRSRLIRSRSAPVPSTILVNKKKITKVAKKSSPTKKMTTTKHIQTHTKPPLAKRQISDDLTQSAYNDCAKVLHASPFDSLFWQNMDLAASTASTKIDEVQCDIEDAWNNLAELIISQVFSAGADIEPCECPPPSLKDVADDEDLCGLQFLEEDELLDGSPFDYSYEGLELEEPLPQDLASEQ